MNAYNEISSGGFLGGRVQLYSEFLSDNFLPLQAVNPTDFTGQVILFIKIFQQIKIPIAIHIQYDKLQATQKYAKRQNSSLLKKNLCLVRGAGILKFKLSDLS